MKKRHQSSLFATEADLRPALAELESHYALVYVEINYYSSPDKFIIYKSQSEIDWLGIAVHGDSVACKALLVQKSNVPVLPREINFGGKPTFAIDQRLNSSSITLRPGGKFGKDYLIIGSFGTIHANKESLGLFRSLSSIIESRFRKVTDYWLGSEAFDLLQSGWCLTPSANIPRSYGLEPVLF